jgi:hypothetical protein
MSRGRESMGRASQIKPEYENSSGGDAHAEAPEGPLSFRKSGSFELKSALVRSTDLFKRASSGGSSFCWPFSGADVDADANGVAVAATMVLCGYNCCKGKSCPES